MAASVLHWLSARDHRLMRRVNRCTPPRWMRLWMVAATSRRRRLAVVRSGRGGGVGRRPGAFPGAAGGRAGGERWHRVIPELEASLRAQAPLRVGAPFLGNAASAGSIFVPLRPYDHGVRDGDFA